MPFEEMYNPAHVFVLSLIVAPVFTSLLLAKAILNPATSFARRTVFHLVAIPALIAILVCCMRFTSIVTPNSLLFFTVFVVAMYGYLQVGRAVRRISGQHNNEEGQP